MTVSTVGQRRTASSTVFFSSTILPFMNPPSAVITTRDSESSIRPERFARLVTLAGMLIESAKGDARLSTADVVERLHVTEKFRRTDFGHMQFQITYDDPETLTRPLTLSVGMNYAADTDMLENVCNEGNIDKVHLVGTEQPGVEVNSAVLAKYVGRYEFREG